MKKLFYLALAGILLLPIGCSTPSDSPASEALSIEWQIEQFLTYPETKAMLHVIAEFGTLHGDPDGYDRYAYAQIPERITDFSDHPRKGFGNCDPDKEPVTNVDTFTCTEAAGRYEILPHTWDELNKANNGYLKDFSPPYQDAAAMFLVVESGAWLDFLQNNPEEGFKKLSRYWSLGSPIVPPELTEEDLKILVDRYHEYIQYYEAIDKTEGA